MLKNIFPEIKTERLILNEVKKEDIKDIVKILNRKIYSDNTINIPYPYTEDSALFWLDLARRGLENKEQFIFAIRRKDNNKIIGGIDLGIDKRFNKAELGYWIDETFFNKGIATEAAKAIIEFGFEKLNLKRIYATHFDFNLSSGKVMEKSGMKKEGILNCHTYKNGEYQNHVLYAIINNS